MKDEDIVKVLTIGFIGLVVAPMIIGGALTLIGTGCCITTNKVNTIKYNRKIKKGLKNGSIININGQYYEVQND